TFFLVGEQVERNAGLAGEIVAAGHDVALHCHRHRNLLRLGPRAVARDLARASALIEDATGRRPELYRPPYAIFNASPLRWAGGGGLGPLFGTPGGGAWEPGRPP